MQTACARTITNVESAPQRFDDASKSHRLDDESEPERVDEPSLRSPVEGLVLAVFGLAAAVAATWLTAVSLGCLQFAVDCSSDDEGDLAGLVIGAVLVTALVTLSWMVVFTLVRGAANRRAPSMSTWLLLPATLAAFSIGPVVVIADRQPIAVDPACDAPLYD